MKTHEDHIDERGEDVAAWCKAKLNEEIERRRMLEESKRGNKDEISFAE